MLLPEEEAHEVNDGFTRKGSAWETFPPGTLYEEHSLYRTDVPCDVVGADGVQSGPCWANSGQFEIVRKREYAAGDGFIYEEDVRLVRYWVEKTP